MRISGNLDRVAKILWTASSTHTLVLLIFGSIPATGLGGETIIAFGDSTTNRRSVGAAANGRPAGFSSQGSNIADPANVPHNTVALVADTSEFLYVYSDMLRDMLAKTPFDLEAVDNEGVGGNRTDQALSRLHQDVLVKSPQTVIVQFGINDSAHDSGPGTPSRIALDFSIQTGGDGVLGNGNDHPSAGRGNYLDNLTQLVEVMQLSGIEVILMTPNQVIDYSAVTNARLGLYAEAVREVSASQRTPLVDVWQIYERMSRIGVDISTLLLDGLHPNATGQRLVADALFQLVNDPQPPNGIVGDVNQDGVVFGDGTQPMEIDDVSAFLAGWLTTGHSGAVAMYSHGDMNFDGITDLADAFILHAALPGGLDFALLTTLPEPSSAVLGVVGVLALTRRDCRRRR